MIRRPTSDSSQTGSQEPKAKSRSRSKQQLDANLSGAREVRLPHHRPIDRAEERVAGIVLVLPLVVDDLVQHIEQLGPDLQPRAASQAGRLREVEIELVERRTPDLVVVEVHGGAR